MIQWHFPLRFLSPSKLYFPAFANLSKSNIVVWWPSDSVFVGIPSSSLGYCSGHVQRVRQVRCKQNITNTM